LISKPGPIDYSKEVESREGDRDGKQKHEEMESGSIPLFDFKREKVLLKTLFYCICFKVQ
jgi:hypothetical protein